MGQSAAAAVLLSDGESKAVLPSGPSESANEVSSSALPAPALDEREAPKRDDREGTSTSGLKVTFDRPGVAEPSLDGELKDLTPVLGPMTSFLTLGRDTKAFGLRTTSSESPFPRRRGEARAGVPRGAEREEDPTPELNASGDAPAAGEEAAESPKPRKRVILVEERLTGVPRKAVKIGGFFFSSTGRAGELPAFAKSGLEP